MRFHIYVSSALSLGVSRADAKCSISDLSPSTGETNDLLAQLQTCGTASSMPDDIISCLGDAASATESQCMSCALSVAASDNVSCLFQCMGSLDSSDPNVDCVTCTWGFMSNLLNTCASHRHHGDAGCSTVFPVSIDQAVADLTDCWASGPDVVGAASCMSAKGYNQMSFYCSDCLRQFADGAAACMGTCNSDDAESCAACISSAGDSATQTCFSVDDSQSPDNATVVVETPAPWTDDLLCWLTDVVILAQDNATTPLIPCILSGNQNCTSTDVWATCSDCLYTIVELAPACDGACTDDQVARLQFEAIGRCMNAASIPDAPSCSAEDQSVYGDSDGLVLACIQASVDNMTDCLAEQGITGLSQSCSDCVAGSPVWSSADCYDDASCAAAPLDSITTEECFDPLGIDYIFDDPAVVSYCSLADIVSVGSSDAFASCLKDNVTNGVIDVDTCGTFLSALPLECSDCLSAGIADQIQACIDACDPEDPDCPPGCVDLAVSVMAAGCVYSSPEVLIPDEELYLETGDGSGTTNATVSQDAPGNGSGADDSSVSDSTDDTVAQDAPYDGSGADESSVSDSTDDTVSQDALGDGSGADDALVSDSTDDTVGQDAPSSVPDSTDDTVSEDPTDDVTEDVVDNGSSSATDAVAEPDSTDDPTESSAEDQTDDGVDTAGNASVSALSIHDVSARSGYEGSLTPNHLVISAILLGRVMFA